MNLIFWVKIFGIFVNTQCIEKTFIIILIWCHIYFFCTDTLYFIYKMYYKAKV